MDKQKLICLFLGPPGVTSKRVFESIKRAGLLSNLAIEFTMLEIDSRYGELLSSVSESIYRSLEKADLIIADITDGNPNVMYELGFAHALKKPVLPIVQRDTAQIPSDLRGYIYFAYEPDDLDNLLLSVVGEWLRRNYKSTKEA